MYRYKSTFHIFSPYGRSIFLMSGCCRANRYLKFRLLKRQRHRGLSERTRRRRRHGGQSGGTTATEISDIPIYTYIFVCCLLFAVLFFRVQPIYICFIQRYFKLYFKVLYIKQTTYIPI